MKEVPRAVACLALILSMPAAGAAAPLSSGDWVVLPDRAPAPSSNPTTPARVELGRKLFFDPALSRSGKIACASCHDLNILAGADGAGVASGIGGKTGVRNTPTVWNAAFQARLFWDGRAASLEEQAKGPLVNPVEMGMKDHAAVERAVAALPIYQVEFRQTFGGSRPITIDNIVAAIASFERTLITSDTPYDRYVRGDRTALGEAQVRGMKLFENYGCRICHSGPNFSGASLFDPAMPFRAFPALPMFATPYVVRYRLTQDLGRAAPGARQGLWRVPSLRNVALTAPYFHNGSVDRLEDVVRIMVTAQLGRPTDKSDHNTITGKEVADIVAFLNSLSSDRLVAARTRRGAKKGGIKGRAV